MTARLLFAALLYGCLASPCVAETEPVWRVESLMAGLHEIKEAKAHFVERKYAAMLTEPILSSGTLSYSAPSRLEKITLAPVSESMMLNNDTLSGIQANGDTFSISLSDHPEIAALVEAVRATMAGDLATLRRYYSIAFIGSSTDWHLALTPIERSVRKKVDLIRIDGAGTQINAVEVLEKDGDRSEMAVSADNP